jgi:hypothetical protein
MSQHQSIPAGIATVSYGGGGGGGGSSANQYAACSALGAGIEAASKVAPSGAVKSYVSTFGSNVTEACNTGVTNINSLVNKSPNAIKAAGG